MNTNTIVRDALIDFILAHLEFRSADMRRFVARRLREHNVAVNDTTIAQVASEAQRLAVVMSEHRSAV